MSDALESAQAAMEAARKKLTNGLQNGGGKAEDDYAAAYRRMCAADPARYRPLRRKYTQR